METVKFLFSFSTIFHLKPITGGTEYEKQKKAYEDNSVLALLYDEHKRRHPETIESIQREIEALYEELHGSHLLNAEEVTAVVVAMGEDRCRYAHVAGVRVGVQLALDLELDSMMGGCAQCF